MIEKIFAAIDLFAKYVGKTVVLTIRQSKGAMANGLILTQYSYDAAGTRQSVSHSVPVVTGSVPSGSELPPVLQLQTTRRDYVGSCILQYYQLERILIPGGYIDADGKYYFYHTDYQGNNRAVVDAEGYVAQRTDYYPYGLPMRQKSADAQPYKYSGKEFDPINGLNTYDFHARVYNPDKSVFGSPDFHAFDYPEQSVYSYCGGNPILFIDPNGMDTHHYDANGNYMYTESNDEYDSVVLHINGALEESERMAYGTIEDVWRWKSADGGYYDYLKVRGDDNAKMLFEFFVNNIGLEYMLFQCGLKGSAGINYLATSHKKERDSAGPFLFHGQLINGYCIRRIIHNHPSKFLFPSQTDLDSANNISAIMPKVEYYIYTIVSWPGNIHYRKYDSKTEHHKLTPDEKEYLHKGILYKK